MERERMCQEMALFDSELGEDSNTDKNWPGMTPDSSGVSLWACRNEGVQNFGKSWCFEKVAPMWCVHCSSWASVVESTSESKAGNFLPLTGHWRCPGLSGTRLFLIKHSKDLQVPKKENEEGGIFHPMDVVCNYWRQILILCLRCSSVLCLRIPWYSKCPNQARFA